MKVLLFYTPGEAHWAALRAAAPAAEFLVATSEAEARQLIPDCEVVLGNRFFWQSLPYARSLRWMQSNSMGVDLILERAGDQLRHIVVTSARGVYSGELAEHTLALLLGITRGLGLARDHQRAHLWGRWALPMIAGKRALVLGWGETGKQIGRRLRAFDVTVTGVRRRHDGPPTMDDTGCLVHGPATWRDALGHTDILILVLPLTAETRQLVGQAELAALPTGAVVINVGRGDTLDQQALRTHLQSGHLYGAGLDVFSTEPLPPDHPLWDEERLLITPHVARGLEIAPYLWEPLFVENLRRYGAGEPLLNVVDQEAGY
jgi:phosphoglycerate dehydrogenase-like enzyme